MRTQYLVTIATSRDDLPAKLCDTEAEVREYLSTIGGGPDIRYESGYGDERDPEFPLFPNVLLDLCRRVPPAAVYGCDVWKFVDGLPVAHETLHNDDTAVDFAQLPQEFFS